MKRQCKKYLQEIYNDSVDIDRRHDANRQQQEMKLELNMPTINVNGSE